MTSTERHLFKGDSRWNHEVQRYKDTRDPFLESGLFSIVVIALGRPNVTQRSVLSTLDCIKDYEGEVEWIFVENGKCNKTYEFFQEIDLERKVVIRQRNYGINEALNQGWALSRGEFVMIHENDWLATRPGDFLTRAKQIFDRHSTVGIVHLRDPLDPSENHGVHKPEYNPWSCTQEALDAADIKVWREKTEDGHAYLISDYPNGFSNNPVIIRKQVYRECGPYPEPEVGTDPRHGETEYQERVRDLGCDTAYVGMPIYWHMGKVQTKFGELV